MQAGGCDSPVQVADYDAPTYFEPTGPMLLALVRQGGSGSEARPLPCQTSAATTRSWHAPLGVLRSTMKDLLVGSRAQLVYQQASAFTVPMAYRSVCFREARSLSNGSSLCPRFARTFSRGLFTLGWDWRRKNGLGRFNKSLLALPVNHPCPPDSAWAACKARHLDSVAGELLSSATKTERKSSCRRRKVV